MAGRIISSMRTIGTSDSIFFFNMIGKRDCLVLRKQCSRKGETNGATKRRNTERMKFLVN